VILILILAFDFDLSFDFSFNFAFAFDFLLILLLGGAALQRCDPCLPPFTALAAEGKPPRSS
jgi:hypothetical protein